MKTNIKRLSLLVLIFTLINCQNTLQKEKKLTKSEYGKWLPENDSFGVELKLNQFHSWKELCRRIEQITCKDSFPKLTLKNKNELKTIYFQNECIAKYACILIKQKNTITIHNDTISKNNNYFYPLDSLASVLKRDIENKGVNPRLSESPDKLLFYISYDKNGIKKLPKTLDKLTQIYKEITNKTAINIYLNEKLIIPPPPQAK